MTFKQIQCLVASDLDAVETEMNAAIASDVSLIREISQHILAGGKRIRPLLTLLMYYAVSPSPSSQPVTLATIIEFIHTATLLHDDVVDHSTMRRGIATANQLWGNEASVLVGDFLYSRAFQLLVGLNQQALMPILAKAISVMAEGEVLQLMNRHDASMTENTYFRIIHAKTAILFQATCEMVASLAELPLDTQLHIAQFGQHFGLAFQLVDDALDYAGDAEELGKNIGDDLAEGKMTLPLIHALHHATPEERQLLMSVIATGEVTQLEQVKKIITQYQSMEHTLMLARQHQHQALQTLDFLPDSNYKNGLMQLLDFILTRNY